MSYFVNWEWYRYRYIFMLETVLNKIYHDDHMGLKANLLYFENHINLNEHNSYWKLVYDTRQYAVLKVLNAHLSYTLMCWTMNCKYIEICEHRFIDVPRKKRAKSPRLLKFLLQADYFPWAIHDGYVYCKGKHKMNVQNCLYFVSLYKAK